MDPISYIISVIGLIVTIITVFISNRLSFEQSRKLFQIEMKERNSIQNWLEFKVLIKQIAGKLSYTLRRTEILSEDKLLCKEKLTEYRLDINNLTFTLNSDLLKYQDLLEKIKYETSEVDSVFDEYYQYVFKIMSKNEKDFSDYLNNLGKENNWFVSPKCDNNHLLTSVIKEADKAYKQILYSSGKNKRKSKKGQ